MTMTTSDRKYYAAIESGNKAFDALFAKLSTMGIAFKGETVDRQDRYRCSREIVINGKKMAVRIEPQGRNATTFGPVWNGKVMAYIGERRFPERKDFQSWIQAMADECVSFAVKLKAKGQKEE